MESGGGLEKFSVGDCVLIKSPYTPDGLGSYEPMRVIHVEETWVAAQPIFIEGRYPISGYWFLPSSLLRVEVESAK